MNTITLKTVDQNSFSVCVDDRNTTDLFNLLESHPKIKNYKIAVAGIGELNEASINYLYSGYKFPSGKLAEKLFDNQL
jgi:hypothetical protein